MAKRPVPDRPSKAAAAAAAPLPFGGGVMRGGSSSLGDGSRALVSAGGSMRGSLSSIPAAIDLRGMSGLQSKSSSSARGKPNHNVSKGRLAQGGLLSACSGWSSKPGLCLKANRSSHAPRIIWTQLLASDEEI